MQIVLVRDLDGKTFWDALDDAISPRIKSPTPVDKSALSTFRTIFQGRPLKKGTFIFLTLLDPTKMLVSRPLKIIRYSFLLEEVCNMGGCTSGPFVWLYWIACWLFLTKPMSKLAIRSK